MTAICPYCGKHQDICHDDGYGYDEDKRYTQECTWCKKGFAFETTITFEYETFKASCLQDGEHKWVLPNVPDDFPEFYKSFARCSMCGSTKVMGKKDRESLNDQRNGNVQGDQEAHSKGGHGQD